MKFANFEVLTKVTKCPVFEEYIEREWQKMVRKKVLIVLVLCDVDYFKDYNDAYVPQVRYSCL
ncbi:diguanylate cyclase domain-containing protein [Trichodesmium erythraeum]|uniref:diguanylate cyclase domain-containing protein n=1 Tax=Trichodesmium erythraeum TaxID=1206 RepID=UPI00351B9BB3